jgi:hypothetical protein
MLTAPLVLVAVSGAVVAGPLEDALAAHDKGDDANALRLIRPLAEQGSADAQYNLGVMYFTGRGVPKDDAEAAKWFRLAANQGDATAQYNLGVLYFSGTGVPQNRGEAAKWYNLAAEQGYADAQFNLGVMYEHGDGVAQNYGEALSGFAWQPIKGMPRHNTIWALCSAAAKACRRVTPRR